MWHDPTVYIVETDDLHVDVFHDGKLLVTNLDKDLAEQLASELDSFTQEEQDAIAQKIMDYHKDSHSRSGGAYLEKELGYIERFLNGLITHMDNIHKALEPKETKKATIAQALADKEQALVEQLQVTYADLSSSALRDMGKRAFADGHLDYTNEELALRLAIFHVTHK